MLLTVAARRDEAAEAGLAIRVPLRGPPRGVGGTRALAALSPGPQPPWPDPLHALASACSLHTCWPVSLETVSSPGSAWGRIHLRSPARAQQAHRRHAYNVSQPRKRKCTHLRHGDSSSRDLCYKHTHPDSQRLIATTTKITKPQKSKHAPHPCQETI